MAGQAGSPKVILGDVARSRARYAAVAAALFVAGCAASAGVLQPPGRLGRVSDLVRRLAGDRAVGGAAAPGILGDDYRAYLAQVPRWVPRTARH